MKLSYLKLARLGKNDWWRYCLGILLIEVLVYVIGTIFVILPIRLGYSSSIISEEWSYKWFVAGRIITVFHILGVYIALKWIHKRPFSTVISVSGKFSVRRVLVACSIWFLLQFAVLSEFTFTLDNFELENKVWFPLIALSTIIQAAGEEFVYRGYIMQGLYSINPRPVFAVVFSSLMFAGAHYMFTSIEIRHFPFLFITAVLDAVIVIKENRIESVIGLHAAWNMILILYNGI